jgi:endonuclease YncB( thermonuclease family)
MLGVLMIDIKSNLRIASGTVNRVTDGDTFVVDYLDLGWGNRVYPLDEKKPGFCSIRITLPRGGWYDAPEKTARLRYRAATEYLKTLLPVGTEVILTSYVFFTLGRTLASVTLPDGRDVATLMVDAGHTK